MNRYHRGLRRLLAWLDFEFGFSGEPLDCADDCTHKRPGSAAQQLSYKQ